MESNQRPRSYQAPSQANNTRPRNFVESRWLIINCVAGWPCSIISQSCDAHRLAVAMACD